MLRRAACLLVLGGASADRVSNSEVYLHANGHLQSSTRGRRSGRDARVSAVPELSYGATNQLLDQLEAHGAAVETLVAGPLPDAGADAVEAGQRYGQGLTGLAGGLRDLGAAVSELRSTLRDNHTQEVGEAREVLGQGLGDGLAEPGQPVVATRTMKRQSVDEEAGTTLPSVDMDRATITSEPLDDSQATTSGAPPGSASETTLPDEASTSGAAEGAEGGATTSGPPDSAGTTVVPQAELEINQDELNKAEKLGIDKATAEESQRLVRLEEDCISKNMEPPECKELGERTAKVLGRAEAELALHNGAAQSTASSTPAP